MYLTRNMMKTNNFKKALRQNLLISISVPCRCLLNHKLVITAYICNDFEEHEIYMHFISQFLTYEPNCISESQKSPYILVVLCTVNTFSCNGLCSVTIDLLVYTVEIGIIHAWCLCHAEICCRVYQYTPWLQLGECVLFWPWKENTHVQTVILILISFWSL